ncbi:MAG: hypothetical protein ABI646_03350 [Acidobacteriota bacterium]
MTNRRTNNSLLFLTTLGVYLGLVLVGGAAPSVFAHGALTRPFELKDEVEVTDDLEKKPDDEQALETYASALESIFITASEINDTFPLLTEQGRYDFDTYYGINSAGRIEGVSYLGKGVDSGKYSPAIRNLYNSFPHTADSDSKPFRLVFAVEPQNFEFKVAFTQDLNADAVRLSEAYAALLPTLKERHISAARRLMYESTQISSKENQFFIVTRLPRAALDPLLAKDAK